MPAHADSPLIGLDRNERASPWKAVGRLETGRGGFCTATLIAPDQVLSAAHCVFDRQGNRRPVEGLTFKAGFREGDAEAISKVAQIALPDAYQYKGGNPVVRIANDVVLLRLATPIPTHVIDPFVVEPRAMRSGDVSVVSYGEGRESLPSLQHTCSVLRSFRGVMAMDCNTTFGSSGAPVFRREGVRIRIVSIVSGSAVIGGVRRTTGMQLPEIVAALKSRMIAEKTAPAPVVRRIGVGARTGGGAKFIRSSGS